jgi:hypothetical protein
MEVFRHCAERKSVWKDLDLLSLDSADHPFLQRLLRLVNSLGLFEEIVMAFFAFTWRHDESEEDCVLSGINLNNCLEILDIDLCVDASAIVWMLLMAWLPAVAVSRIVVTRNQMLNYSSGLHCSINFHGWPPRFLHRGYYRLFLSGQ